MFNSVHYGDRVEITGGLDPDARVVASGGGFLAENDTVRLVDGTAAASSAAIGTTKAKAPPP